MFLIAASISAAVSGPRHRVYGRKGEERGREGAEQRGNFFGTIIFSYEKFRVRPSGNINRVKVANKKVLSANLAYANTGEQSG